jgi:DNA repair exonuclease SbcCD ATPase subunit
MIVEGFTVENWSCIRRVSVSGLPHTGVVVLHGPNGTGKSSIVAALRATLMDYAPTSTKADLARWLPVGGNEPPRVSVEFRAAGRSYRVTKQFKKGRSDSALEERTGAGWQTITQTPAEVHDRTQALVGSGRSDQGLYQLLWLPQAKFELPAEDKFDADVQTRLRQILGVMQTPRDDRFISLVRARRSAWYGTTTKLKESCDLAKNIKALETYRKSLDETEAQYRQVEQIERDIRQRTADEAMYRQQLASVTQTVEELRAAFERTRQRRTEWELAGQRVEAAEKALADARRVLDDRRAAAGRLAMAERDTADALLRMESTAGALAEGLAAVQRAADLVAAREEDRRRELERLRRAEAHARLADLDEKVRSTAETLTRAEELARRLTEHRRRLADEPAPDDATLQKIAANRERIARLSAERQAAAIALTVELEPGHDGQLAVDGRPAAPVAGAAQFHVSRTAELALPGVGRVVVRRGSDAGTVEELDAELRRLEDEFVTLVGPFGLPADQPGLLDALRERRARRQAREPNVRADEQELNRLAPDGVDALRESLAELRRKREAAPTPDGPAEDAEKVRGIVNHLEQELGRARDTHARAVDAVERGPGALRAAAEKAAADHLVANTRAATKREALDRFPPEEQLVAAVVECERRLAAEQEARASAALTEEEQVAGERLDAAVAEEKNLADQIGQCHRDLADLRGKLSMTVGLHQRRAEAEARVEILKQRIDHERLEADAYQRLFELFDECRDRQVATVLEPITRRVCRWMKLAGIGGYGDIAYSDSFLPTRLLGRDGGPGLSLEQESTGTREQLTMMVRLALGSVLAGNLGEPAVAVLDDPLTHSDAARLTQMRAILKSAAEGDPAGQPPAGPLQILVFTCHREWFAAGAAMSVDLGRPDILERIR